MDARKRVAPMNRGSSTSRELYILEVYRFMCVTLHNLALGIWHLEL